jgi:hypothetical protein
VGSNPTSTALTCTNAGLGGSWAAASCPASLIWSSQFSTVERYPNRVRRNCLARSQKSWTCLNGEAHAVQACALAFRLAGTVRDRPDAGRLKECVTLSDRSGSMRTRAEPPDCAVNCPMPFRLLALQIS